MCNMGMWDVERWDFGVCGDGDAGCGVQETWDTVLGDMGCGVMGIWGRNWKERGTWHEVMGVWDVE